jgi:type IV secretory pathway TraG/TraD family ATPase VirD4
LVLVLDEAANVCRWPELPNLYSHYGSRGILISTILQSYPQGEAVWGEKGMEKLFTAANWLVYLGGNKPGAFLSRLSDAAGEYYYTTPGSRPSATGPGGPPQEHKDRIFDASELSAMPRGRALLLSSGNSPLLLRTIPWMQDPVMRPKVEASILQYDPAATKTIERADNAVRQLRTNPDATPGPVV